MLTNDDLAAVRERAEAATPGKWDEEWRPVAGYEGLYDVSNMGRVRSHLKPGRHTHKKLAAPRVMTTSPRKGRISVCLTRDGVYKTRMVHRLVATAFHGPCPDGMECAHLNGDYRDNRAENLQWTTHVENESHKVRHGTAPIGEANGAAKLVGWQVAEIKYLADKGIPQARIADLFDINKQSVHDVLNGRAWAHESARSDIPALLAHIDALTARVAELERENEQLATAYRNL